MGVLYVDGLPGGDGVGELEDDVFVVDF